MGGSVLKGGELVGFATVANKIVERCREAVCADGLEHEQFEQRVGFLYETLPDLPEMAEARLFQGASPDDTLSLDTGDADMPPFAPAVDALREAVERVGDYGKYLRPYARSDVQPAVLGFLQRRCV